MRALASALQTQLYLSTQLLRAERDWQRDVLPARTYRYVLHRVR